MRPADQLQTRWVVRCSLPTAHAVALSVCAKDVFRWVPSSSRRMRMPRRRAFSRIANPIQSNNRVLSNELFGILIAIGGTEATTVPAEYKNWANGWCTPRAGVLTLRVASNLHQGVQGVKNDEKIKKKKKKKKKKIKNNMNNQKN